MHRRFSTRQFPGSKCFSAFCIAVLSIAMWGATPAAAAEFQTLAVQSTGAAIEVDGDLSEWGAIDGITVSLNGRGGVDSVELCRQRSGLAR